MNEEKRGVLTNDQISFLLIAISVLAISVMIVFLLMLAEYLLGRV